MIYRYNCIICSCVSQNRPTPKSRTCACDTYDKSYTIRVYGRVICDRIMWVWGSTFFRCPISYLFIFFFLITRIIPVVLLCTQIRFVSCRGHMCVKFSPFRACSVQEGKVLNHQTKGKKKKNCSLPRDERILIMCDWNRVRENMRKSAFRAILSSSLVTVVYGRKRSSNLIFAERVCDGEKN